MTDNCIKCHYSIKKKYIKCHCNWSGREIWWYFCKTALFVWELCYAGLKTCDRLQKSFSENDRC